MKTDLRQLLRTPPVLLSGGMGTELNRRGMKTDLPLWSAAALVENPQLVKDIHKDYLATGVQVITTNTFRTNPRAIEQADKGLDARELTLLACKLAREARDEVGEPDVLIGGSMGPAEDCYSPELVPPDDELLREHAMLANWLAEGGVDFLLPETINTIREARAASIAAKATGLPFAISFVCNEAGDLLSGERMEDVVKAVMPYGPVALLTNCVIAAKIGASVTKLVAHSPVPVGVYGNGLGHPNDAHGWTFEGENPVGKYIEQARKWLDEGAAIVGGCCGTTPEYTAALAALFKSRN